MTNDERQSLEVLRAEMNGKLDVLLERTGAMRDDLRDHEIRLRAIEDQAVPAAMSAAKASESLVKGLDAVRKRMWMAVGALGAIIFAINVGLAYWR